MCGIQDGSLKLLVVHQNLVLDTPITLQVRHQIFVGQVLAIYYLHNVFQLCHCHIPVVVSVDRADDLEYFKESCQVLSKQVYHILRRYRLQGLFGPATRIPNVPVEVSWCLLFF